MTAGRYVLALWLALGAISYQTVNATPVQVIAAGAATHTSQDHNVDNPFAFTESASLRFQAVYDSNALDYEPSASFGRYPLDITSGVLRVDGVSVAFAGRTTGWPGLTLPINARSMPC